jgi:hypothetical protein
LIGKKATIDDKIYFLGAFMLVVIGIIAYGLYYTPVYDTLTGLGSTKVNDAMANVSPTNVFNWLDFMAVCFYFAMNVMICIMLPLYVAHNPIYIPVIFLFSFLYTYGCAVVANVMFDFMGSVSISYPMTQLVVQYLVEFEIVWLMIMMTIMFFKRRSTVQGDYYG